MRNVIKDIAVFAVIYVPVALLIVMCKSKHIQTENPTQLKYDTIYSIVHDTIEIIKPQPKTITQYKERTLHDTIIIDNTKIVADIPFEEKEYQDTNYYIKISGFEANIDELKIFQNEKIINTTITKYKQKKFNHGIQIGAGYGIFKKNADIYIGYGITYNF